MKLFIITILFLFKNICFSQEIVLPKPSYKGSVSFEEAIYKWKATRNFSLKSMTLSQLSQLLWSCNGQTIDGISSATRVYPSAGAIYPLEIYIVCGNVEGLKSGVYKYNYKTHSIKLIKPSDIRPDLAKACYYQNFVKDAAVSFVWCSNTNIVSQRYGNRGEQRYVFLDLGHSAQNLTIQATVLNLGCVQVGAFNDQEVKNLLSLPKEENPLYIIPVGYKK